MIPMAKFNLCFLVKVYGLKFPGCGNIKANNIQSQVSVKSNSISRDVKLQLSEREKIVAELRDNPEVMKAMRYDIAIYQKALEIFHQQRDAMTT